MPPDPAPVRSAPLPSELTDALALVNQARREHEIARADVIAAMRREQAADAQARAADAEWQRLVRQFHAAQDGQAAPSTAGTMFRTAAPDAETIRAGVG